MFIAGLLLGVGKLVFLARRAEQYRAVLALAQRSDMALIAAERRTFGFDYAELGAALLHSWRLPEILSFLVGAHLAPSAAQAWQQEATIVFVAADIAAKIAPAIQNRQPASGYLPAYQPEIWQRLGLAQQAIAEIITKSLVQSFEIFEIINPRAAIVF
jgi:HD-like signal output (HDOD) protein